MVADQRPHEVESRAMSDLMFILLTLALFALVGLVAKGAQRL